MIKSVHFNTDSISILPAVGKAHKYKSTLTTFIAMKKTVIMIMMFLILPINVKYLVKHISHMPTYLPINRNMNTL